MCTKGLLEQKGQSRSTYYIAGVNFLENSRGEEDNSRGEDLNSRANSSLNSRGESLNSRANGSLNSRGESLNSRANSSLNSRGGALNSRAKQLPKGLEERSDPKDDPKSGLIQLTERQYDILLSIKDNVSITREQLAQRIGISDCTIIRELAVLKNKGYLNRDGGKTYGKWIVLKEI